MLANNNDHYHDDHQQHQSEDYLQEHQQPLDNYESSTLKVDEMHIQKWHFPLIDESYFDNDDNNRNYTESNGIPLKMKNDSKKYENLLCRINELEINKKNLLLKLEKMQEVTEQNELLEFRILELEGVQDKWSFQSQNTHPDVRDVWTDTESDSGMISSPGSPPTVKHLSFVSAVDDITDIPVFEKPSTGTQTDCKEEPFLELTMEIQKLNEFKKSIEQKKSSSMSVINEEHELQKYKLRCENLESKLIDMEKNASDLRKTIDDFVSRENMLETRFKDLNNRFEKLQQLNRKLEEEKCELEEIENDTRLEYQRLQIDVTYLDNFVKNLTKNQSSLENKISQAEFRIQELEEQLEKSEQRNYELEESECELNQKIDNLTNSSQMNELLDKIEALEKRESSYIETLQLGDEIWMQMEQDYKRKLQESQDLQRKLETQLDEFLCQNKSSAIPLDEHLSELEELVKSMRCEIEKLEAERNKLKKRNFELNNLIDTMSLEQNLAIQILKDQNEKEIEFRTKQNKELLERTTELEQNFTLKELSHENELKILQNQLAKFSTDLVTMDIAKTELNEQLQAVQKKYFELQISASFDAANVCLKARQQVA